MAQLDSFLRESGYRWDPSAFTPLCRAWANATDQERFDFIANVQMMSYDEFLKTIYWGIVSGWKVHIQKNCGCGSRWGLQVHHGTYAHHGEEHRYLNDLIVKCRLCHKEIHGLASAEELMALKRRREQAKDFRHLNEGESAPMQHVSETETTAVFQKGIIYMSRGEAENAERT